MNTQLTNPANPEAPAETALTATPEKHTFYVLVRQDMPLHHQVVQAVHAAAEASRQHYRDEHGIASAIVLTVKDLAGLHDARAKLTNKGVSTELFYEPDFGIGDSALATEPLTDSQRKLLRNWPLWRAPEVPAQSVAA